MKCGEKKDLHFDKPIHHHETRPPQYQHIYFLGIRRFMTVSSKFSESVKLFRLKGPK